MNRTIESAHEIEDVKENRPETEVILISGDPTVESALDAFKRGAVDYMSKPLDIPRLTKSVHHCLDKKTPAWAAPLFPSAAPPEDPHALPIVEGKMSITLLLARIQGISAFSDTVSPDAAVSTLNTYLENLHSIVESEFGQILRFTGSGLSALFLGTHARGSHAERAAAAALTMMREAAGWNHARVGTRLPPLGLGIALNSGDAVMASVGTSRQSDYAVLGQTSEIAARLLEMSNPGDILLGPSTAADISLFCPIRSRGLVNFRGFPNTTSVFAISLSPCNV